MLKPICLATICSLSVLTSAAEVITPMGFQVSGDKVEMALTTPSTLVVNVEVEHTNVIVGPYARYAQKFLGVRATLVAKEESKIVAADVALAPKDYYIATSEMLSNRCCNKVTTTSEPLPIDIISADALSVEEAAEEAAYEIFRIRQLRRDLLSGELGEGFYGGGLDAALSRLEYEESQYVKLFMGSSESYRTSSQYYVTLNGTTARYIIGRFDPKSGVVSDSDLTAEPIILQLTAAEQEQMVTPEYSSKQKTVNFRIDNRVKCDIYQSTKILGSKNIPLVEFGYDYTHPIM